MCAFLQSRRSGNLSRSAYIMANIMNWAHISFVGRAANLLHAYRISIRYTCTKELVDFRNTNAVPQFLAWHEPGMLTKCSLYVGWNVVWLASKFEPRFLTIHASTKIALISTSRVSIALSIHKSLDRLVYFCLFVPISLHGNILIRFKTENSFKLQKRFQFAFLLVGKKTWKVCGRGTSSATFCYYQSNYLLNKIFLASST